MEVDKVGLHIHSVKSLQWQQQKYFCHVLLFGFCMHTTVLSTFDFFTQWLEIKNEWEL